MQEKEEVEEQSLESADWNYVFSQAAKEKSVIGVLILGKRERFSRLEKHCELLQLINSATSRHAGRGPVWETAENKVHPLTTPHPSKTSQSDSDPKDALPNAEEAVPGNSCMKGLTHRGAVQHWLPSAPAGSKEVTNPMGLSAAAKSGQQSVQLRRASHVEHTSQHDEPWQAWNY